MKKSTPTKKAIAETPATKATKAAKPKAAKSVKAETSIEKACDLALDKLKELNIDGGLQSEIQWCLGSYRHDGNPAGLYVMAKRALAAFTVEKANKTKGITAKLISDLEKAIGSN
jgi:hypothetical protein